MPYNQRKDNVLHDGREGEIGTVKLNCFGTGVLLSSRGAFI